MGQLRTHVATLCEKYAALVNTTLPLTPPNARAHYEQRGATVSASAAGFGEAINGALRALRDTNQSLSDTKDSRSARDMALSNSAAQQAKVKTMMTQPPRGEGATRVKREADARAQTETAGAALEEAAQRLEKAEGAYLVKVEQQKAAAGTGFAQTGATCSQILNQYMTHVAGALGGRPPAAPAPARPLPVPGAGAAAGAAAPPPGAGSSPRRLWGAAACFRFG